MTLATVLLQASAPAGGSMGGQWSSIIMMIAIVAIFYFFMIRPQNKRRKEMQKFRDNLTVGQKIVTAGGIYGKIKELKENAVILEVSEGVRIKVDKSSIYQTAADTTQQEAK